MKVTLPNRKTIRLKHYDYSECGLYFITICITDKECLLGHIVDNKMILNDAGKMVEHYYLELANKFNNIDCLDYIVMPNHIHFIIYIKNHNKQKNLLFTIVQWFKTMTTNHYIQNVKLANWQPFNKKLWQRSYYEHIIRNEISYNNIAEYIEYNPLNWQSDQLFKSQ